jgi:hypothetical protein
MAASGTTLFTAEIESVCSDLNEQTRLERRLACTPAGRATRIAQRILALTLGIPLDTVNGPRAACALTAC